jgi:autotransporter-associated beta strand protein
MNANHTVAGFFDGPLAPSSCKVTIQGAGTMTMVAGNLNAMGLATSLDGSVGIITIAVPIAGGTTAGICAENGGEVFLNGNSTAFAGGSYLGYPGASFASGVWHFNDNNAFGTSPIILLNAIGGALVTETSGLNITNAVTMWSRYSANVNTIGWVPLPQLLNVDGFGTPQKVTFSGPWQLANGSGWTGANIYANTSPWGNYTVLTLNTGHGTGDPGDLVNISGKLSGSCALTKGGSGILELSGDNSAFSGPLSITNGTVRIGYPTGLGCNGAVSTNGTVTVVSGATISATLDLNGYAVDAALILNGNGNASGNGALVNSNLTSSAVLNAPSGVLAALITSPFTSTTIAAPVAVSVTGGGGSGATAFASLGVSPATFTINPQSQKYTVMPTIVVSAGGGSNAIVPMPLSAASPAIVSSTAWITAPGFGYSSAPTVTVTGGTTSGTGLIKPTVTANNAFQLMGIQITSPGSGYTSQPTISLSGTGVDPSGVAVGLISSVTLASPSSIGGPGNIAVNSAIGDNGSSSSLTKVGAGTVTLGGVNTYSGATTISGGKLIGVVGGSCASSAVEVQPSKTFGVSIPDNTKQWTCASLTFDDSTTTNEFNFGSVTPSTTLAPLSVTGTVAFTGTPTVSILVSGSLPAGTYPLMTCSPSGLLGTGPTTANLSLPPHVAATLINDGTTLSLVVSGNTEPIKWAVSGTATWNINTTPNWKDNTATAVNYLESAAVPPVGDAVVFDDTYFSTPRTVTLNSTVSPVAVTVNSANSYTISGTGGIAGQTGLSQQGSGTLELDTVNAYTGGTTISSPGALTIGGAGQLGGGTYSAPIANNGTLTYNSSAPQTLSGPISGTGALVQSGASTLVLSGPISYGGGTTISAGTLQLGDGVLFNGTTVAGDILDNANLVFANYYPQTFSGNLSGTGSLTVNGPTSLTLSGGVNSYSGGMTINAGQLVFNNAASQTLSGVISGAGTLVQNGPGTLILTADNPFTGGTVINGGILNVNGIDDFGFSPSALGYAPTSATLLVLGGGTLQYTGASAASTARTVTGTGTIDLPAGNLELQLAKSGIITKTSGGTLTLSGTLDNASLGVTVNAGMVVLNKTSASTVHALGATTTVNTGGTLKLSGTGGDQISSGVAVKVNTGGIFDANGLSEAMTSLTLNGNGSGSGALINNVPATTSTISCTFPLGSDTAVGCVGNLTLTGVMSGAHALSYIGSGILTLSGNSTFSLGLTINAGQRVVLNAGGSAGTGMTTIIGNGALTFNASGNYANGITAGPSCIVNVNSPSGNTALQGDLTAFTGTINCNGGQVLLNVANNAAFPISASATWNIANGATLDLATPYVTDAASVIVNGVGNNAFGCLRLDACNQTGPVLLNAANCTIGNGNAAGASTISGIISDGGHGYGFTRTGTVNDTLVLSAANTYTGPTIINSSGTLDISATGSIKGDATVIAGTLQFDGSANLASTATLNLASAPAAGAVNLNYSGSQTIKALYFGAAQQSSGTWGAVGSSATHQNAAFNPSGAGILNVTTGAVLSTNNVILSISNNTDGTFSMKMLGTPGSIYYMTSSGNVTNAMSAWAPLAGTTNTADGSGNWSTVVSNTAPAFYRSKAVNPAP